MILAWTGDVEAGPKKSMYANWTTKDGRWRVVHNLNSETGLWELYDADDQCHGGWTRLKEARARAQALTDGAAPGWYCNFHQERHPGNWIMQGCPEAWERYCALVDAVNTIITPPSSCNQAPGSV